MNLNRFLRLIAPSVVYLIGLSTIVNPAYAGSAACLNNSETVECYKSKCRKCEISCDLVIKTFKEECPEGWKSYASTVLNGRLTYIHDAVDFEASPGAASGCSTCGVTGAGVGKLPSLVVQRRFYSRIWGNNEMFFSFGRNMYWRNYDNQLIFRADDIRYMDSSQDNSNVPLQHNITRGAWIDKDEQTFGLFLFNSIGQPIVDEIDRNSAKTGTIVRNDGHTEHYEFIEDAAGLIRGRLISLMDRNGNAIEFDYVNAAPAGPVPVADAHLYWQRSKIRDAYGREVTLTYSNHGDRSHVSRIDLPNGEQIDYAYGAWTGLPNFQLVSVDYPDGTQSTFSSQSIAAEGLNQFSFFEAGQSGMKRKKEIFLSKNYGYLPDGTQIATVANQTRKVLNGENEIIYRNHQLFTNQDYSWRFIHEGGNKVTRLQVANKGGISNASHVIDDSWKTDFYAEDPFTWAVETSYLGTYNNIPVRLSASDPFGRTQQETPDNTGALLSAIMPDGTTASNTLNGFKQALLTTDRLGRKNDRTYDANGNLLSETRGFANPSASTTSFLYNAAGQVTEERDPLYDPQFPDLHNTQYTYNANGYLVKITHSADLAGGVRPETILEYDAADRLSKITDPAGREVTFTYDTRNRLVKTTYFDTSFEEVTYGQGDDANLVISRRDRNGILTTYDFDLAGRAIEIKSAAGLPEEIVETCTYLSGTTLKETCIRRGEKTEYTYDHRNRVVATTRHVDANTFLVDSVEYDILSRRRSTTDPYGRRTFYLYDENDSIARTVTETVPGALGAVPDFASNSTQTAVPDSQTITTTSGEDITIAGIHTITYNDPRDQFLENLTRDLNPNAKYLISDRLTDAEGQTLLTTDPRGIQTLMLYDVLGRVVRKFTAVTDPEELLSETDYDTASNVIEIRHPRHFAETDGNGDPIRAVETFTYNGRNLKASHTVADGHPNLEATESWVYHLDGREKSHTDFRGNPNLNLWHVCCGRFQAGVQRDAASTSISNTDFNGNVTHTAVVKVDPSAGGTVAANWHDPVDAETIQEITTRFDGLNRPTFSTAWLVALGEVDDDARANLGTGDIPISNDPAIGLATINSYDEDLTDGIGIDAAYPAQFAELANRGVTFGANANGFASALTNAEGESTITVQDGIGRTVMIIDGEGNITTRHYDVLETAANLAVGLSPDIPLPGDLLSTKSIDANGNVNVTYSDGAGRSLVGGRRNWKPLRRGLRRQFQLHRDSRSKWAR